MIFRIGHFIGHDDLYRFVCWDDYACTLLGLHIAAGNKTAKIENVI